MGTKGTTSYRIGDQNSLHYITMTTVEWVDIFTRRIYKNILLDSLNYCRKHKGLELYAYVIMSNHMHLICRAREGFNLSDILRDFKRHTAKHILKEINENPQESRKKWLLEILERAGSVNPKNETYQLWRQDNHPVELSSNEMIDQKLEYIHNNPVEAGVVSDPGDYLYSSARNYSDKEQLIEIDYL